MPTMVDAAEETERYSIPVPDLGAGEYVVRWRASAAGAEHAGILNFRIR
jgi:methionine-rich copper-binding protein CopC